MSVEAPSSSSAAGDRHSLSGAGATFPAPIYDQWFAAFPHTAEGLGVQVHYDAVGSGKGIALPRAPRLRWTPS
jgi:phosphate transport system substrate-binding protein